MTRSKGEVSGKGPDFGAVYDLFFEAGEVTEIRAFGLKTRKSRAWEGWASPSATVYGYFNNARAFAEAAAALEEAQARGVYFVLNPVKPDLLARAANRLRVAGPKDVTTADKDILRVRWLPVDLDPVRPAGISSTRGELDAAFAVQRKIRGHMTKERGWPEPVLACSGNGAHLVFRFEPMAPQEAEPLVRAALRYLASQFGDDEVHVDEKVYNPARIWKLYGTTARKGDHTPERPHRRSYVMKAEAA